MDRNQDRFCLCLTLIPARGLLGLLHWGREFPEGLGPEKSGRQATFLLSFEVLRSFNHIFQDIFQGGWFHLKSIFFMGP